jgi:tryptophan synthase beta subunit
VSSQVAHRGVQSCSTPRTGYSLSESRSLQGDNKLFATDLSSSLRQCSSAITANGFYRVTSWSGPHGFPTSLRFVSVVHTEGHDDVTENFKGKFPDLFFTVTGQLERG